LITYKIILYHPEIKLHDCADFIKNQTRYLLYLWKTKNLVALLKSPYLNIYLWTFPIMKFTISTPNVAMSYDTAQLLQNSLGDIISMIIKGTKNARRY